MAAQINSKKSKWFRWHDSGDVQSLKHLAKIFKVCKLTPGVKHWMPTREAWTQRFQDRAPSNLTIRFSMPMVDQPAAGNWRNTSTVVTDEKKATCPAPKQDNKCGDCRACWDPSVKMWLILHTKMGHFFKHPKYYEELRRRGREEKEVSSTKQQATSAKQQASSHERQASSAKLLKLQATSVKRRATGFKRQATSDKRQDARAFIKF